MGFTESNGCKIQCAPKVSGHPREPYGKPLFSQGEKVVKFSFDFNENFFVGSLTLSPEILAAAMEDREGQEKSKMKVHI